VTLNWIDHSTNETLFEIHRAARIKGKFDYVIIGAATSPSYEDAGVEFGDYIYKVRAINVTGVELRLAQCY
jgi:hypothetical protein